jgi:heptosyltransferase-2
LRTTPLLPGLKRKYPQSFISWLVDEESVELLQNNPLIDRILPFNWETGLSLLVQTFDCLISLDKEPGPASLATQVKASEKFGFGLNEHGNLRIFNEAAEYAYRLGIDDPLKFFANRKTYQELIFEIAELEYKKDDYIFYLKEESLEKAKMFFKKNKVAKSRIAVGLNTGAGTKFETKQWPRENFLELISLLRRDLRANVFLLGGPRERELNLYLEKKARSQGFRVFNTGNDNSLPEFAGFLSLMDIVLCSDTLAMHLALALRKKTVVLFGPTCPQEIELYGRGAKIFLGVSCSPCYKQTCPDGKCMSRISARKVFQEIRKLAGARHG